MTRIFLASMALSLSVIAPLSAQEWQMPPAEEPPVTAPDEPLSDFEQGIESMMNEMFQRFQPHLEGLGNELAETVTEFGPAFEELAGLMDDIGNYQRPERLPNGDISSAAAPMRRRRPPPMNCSGFCLTGTNPEIRAKTGESRKMTSPRPRQSSFDTLCPA
ncbi:hypothetical protein [Paracoccus sp. SCSIO 75233]|uniref:hypothetical protein n=1 Tax=Paracoccus sp. SCSIO 75233 TaxID=3017782 RepID=UPI0022F065AA|nr:hypothetical protein [Paracoccus sp. SCSIO 75233]WBU54484.1 hypothetical protein PAF12_06545 [Paracoccus sp. SCSIO 75233]